MKRSARVSVGEKYGISKIATAVNKKPTAWETGPHRARNAPSMDHSRSTAIVTAAMWESARTWRRERFMVIRQACQVRLYRIADVIRWDEKVDPRSRMALS